MEQILKERRPYMGIFGLLLLIILLVYFVLPAAGAPGGGRYAPRYGWGGPSLVSLLLIVLIICLIIRAVPVVWY